MLKVWDKLNETRNATSKLIVLQDERDSFIFALKFFFKKAGYLASGLCWKGCHPPPITIKKEYIHPT